MVFEGLEREAGFWSKNEGNGACHQLFQSNKKEQLFSSYSFP